MRFERLQGWLDWQQTLHPREIDLSLDRVMAVGTRLGVLTPRCPVVTVAGTNGKGSTVAYLESIFSAAGYRTAAYTSPHLLRYNERIRVAQRVVADERIVAAFERVDDARGEISLTYFEFGTLAALEVFTEARCDVWLLEVGLGGRLDAVNAVDSDVAVVTSIGLDHMEWLGPDRDSIGYEKAGIARRGKPLIVGDREPPASVCRHALEVEAVPVVAGRDYHWRSSGTGWSWFGKARRHFDLPLPGVRGGRQLGNAATALSAVEHLGERLPVTESAIAEGLSGTELPGRFQVLPGPVEWVLDVAHNEDSAKELAATLGSLAERRRNVAVFAMLARKDLVAVLDAMAEAVDSWFLVSLPDKDAAPAAEASRAVADRFGEDAILGIEPADVMMDRLDGLVRPGDRVVVFGSFRTVAEVLRYLPIVRQLGKLAAAVPG